MNKARVFLELEIEDQVSTYSVEINFRDQPSLDKARSCSVLENTLYLAAEELLQEIQSKAIRYANFKNKT